jgi:hypothetical protein
MVSLFSFTLFGFLSGIFESKIQIVDCIDCGSVHQKSFSVKRTFVGGC